MGEYIRTHQMIHQLRKSALEYQIEIAELKLERLKQGYAAAYEHKDILEYDGCKFYSLQECLNYINDKIDALDEMAQVTSNQLEEAYGYLAEFKNINGE